jgi:mannose-6-phosphate isomerase-like protein (cupin superfamily)
MPPGSGPKLHQHPYAEIFVVDTGQADFQVGESRLMAHAGDILIAPAGAAHRFTSAGEDQLRLTAIHTAATIETEWLASDGGRTFGEKLGHRLTALPGTPRRVNPHPVTRP